MAVGAALLPHTEIVFVDVNEPRLDALSRGLTPMGDKAIEERLAKTPYQIALPSSLPSGIDLAIVCVPTDFVETKGEFDVSHVEEAVENLHRYNPSLPIIIKSTCPIGFTSILSKHYPNHVFYYVPEFLTEAHALEDFLRPSRLVIGCQDPKNSGDVYLLLMKPMENKPEVVICTYEEAESIKLFSNAYLAMRVAFFNELDTYASEKGLDSSTIIHGVGLDPRIGSHYNSPSFGYGGYCLPKDSKQLLSSFGEVPENLIWAIIESNKTRKQAIVNRVLDEVKKRGGNVSVGIDRLVMKTGATSFRHSPVLEIISSLNQSGVRLFLFEPLLDSSEFLGAKVVDEVTLKRECSIILHTLNGRIEIL